MPNNPEGGTDNANRSFGLIEGDFAGKVSGEEGSRYISYGCRVTWANSITPRKIPDPDSILREQDRTPVAVIGPFGNVNDDEITEVAYPPEREIDLAASYQGTFGPVSWKRTRFARGRHLDLTRELSGADGAGTLAYALQFVWSPEEMGVYLMAQHQGGIVAWINGAKVLRYHSVHRRSKDDALRGLGRLKRGWNKILVKVESFTGDCTFQFRLTGLDRRLIPALKFSDQVKTAE
jgi:hypothetical protein